MSLGQAVLELVTDGSKLTSGLNKSKGDIGMFSKVAAGAFGIAVVGAGALAAAAMNIGENFDAAYDKIAIGTGATGQVLEGLKGDFQAVFTAVPTSMEAASEAITTLHQRTGLVGPALQTLAVQYLELGRITDTDVKPLIENTTRAFAAFGIETQDQGKYLDQMFVASQKTGIGVDALATSVDNFGPILRAAGFDLTTSIALIAQMEKAGLPTETVVSGLGIAAKNFAKENIPLNEGLIAVVAKIKEMGPGAEATKLSVDTFGRSGVILADAIHKDAFTINDELLGALKAADGNITTTATSTDDWSEKVNVLQNKLTTALAPAGKVVFEGLGALVEWLTPYIVQLATWLGENLPGAMATVGEWLHNLQPLFEALGTILGFIFREILPRVAAGFGEVASVVGSVIQGVSGLIGWLKSAWEWANNVIAAARNIPGIGGVIGAITGHAAGTDHITRGPELFVAGEAGPERVNVTPLRGGASEGGGGAGHGHEVVMDGRVVGGLLGRRTVRGTALAGGAIG